MTEKLLLEALDLASEGRKTEARRLLEEVLRQDSCNETAWLWLADCSDSPEEREQALQNCLRCIPDSQRARAALSRLRIAARAADRVPVTGSELLMNSPNVSLDPFNGTDPGEGANVFTVPPELLSPEEFARIEARTETTLHKRPDLRPLKVQLARRRALSINDWTEMARTNGKRKPRPRVEQTQPVSLAPRKNRIVLYAAAALALFMVLVGILAVSAIILLRAG